MMKALARPLTVVAHDAGAANHIFAWLGDEQPTMCLEGPARDLWFLHLKKTGSFTASKSGLPPDWNSMQSPLNEFGLVAAISEAATVITGTGWQNSMEHDARKLARERGIRSIAVIDHWINYEERFVRNGEQVLPEEIWVSDHYAAEIAKATFPTVRVIQQVNAYLKGLVADFESLQPQAAGKGNDRVLYVLEPIRHMWGELAEPGEFMALNYFMAQLKSAPVALNAEIRLRAHPSDPPGKYDAWLTRQAHPRVSLDRSATLAEALMWSNLVVGCQTYAMVVALACGRTVISSIPPWAPPCALPQPEIRLLSRLGGAEC